MISLLVATIIQTCSIGPAPFPGWNNVLGEPLCPPSGIVQKETPENLAHIQAQDFLQGSIGYPMEPSIKGELAYFRNSAHIAVADAQRAQAQSVPVEERIIEHLGVDVVPLGKVTSVKEIQINASTSEFILTFSSGAVYQYFRRIPIVTPNGRTIVILHGCGASARTTVLGDEEDYMARVGKLFIDAGWGIIVPYLNSNCFMDNQIDKLGQTSGTNHLAYEIMGVRAAIIHSGIKGNLSLYGVSKGGIVALFLGALDSATFDTVTISGHDIFDFLRSGIPYFSRPNRAKHFAYSEKWNRYITADEMVIDYMTDNKSGHVIIEMSTHDSNNGKGIDVMMKLVESCKALFHDCTSRFRIIWFYGTHQIPSWYTTDYTGGVCAEPFINGVCRNPLIKESASRERAAVPQPDDDNVHRGFLDQ